jgi:hypothetical protein
MRRTNLAAALAVCALLTFAGTCRAVNGYANASFNGTTIALVNNVKGQGSGTMSAGTVRYQMTVTGVSVNGAYVTLVGTLKGTSASVPYTLTINRKNNTAYWSVNKGQTQGGKGTYVVR